MTRTGTITKIQNDRVLVKIALEGATCANCSCEKPTKIIASSSLEAAELQVGELVLLESSPAVTALHASILALVAGAGFYGGWILATMQLPTLVIPAKLPDLPVMVQVGGGLAGALLCLLIGTVVAPLLGLRNLPTSKKIRIQRIQSST